LSITLNSKLNEITGFKKLQKSISLSIYDNPVLESINSFDSISSVKQNILILRNSKLRSLIGLNILRTARNIEISNHDSLSTLDVLNNLANTEGDLIINKNKFLKKWNICKNLIHVSGGLELRESQLDTLIGFENLAYCKKLFVADLNIKHLNSFNKLENAEVISVRNRKNLLTIKGFDNLKFATSISITNNDSL